MTSSSLYLIFQQFFTFLKYSQKVLNLKINNKKETKEREKDLVSNEKKWEKVSLFHFFLFLHMKSIINIALVINIITFLTAVNT